jgi:hypothetical protein
MRCVILYLVVSSKKTGSLAPLLSKMWIKTITAIFMMRQSSVMRVCPSSHVNLLQEVIANGILIYTSIRDETGTGLRSGDPNVRPSFR